MFSSENRTVRKVGGGLYRAFLSFNNSRFMDFFHYKPYQDDRTVEKPARHEEMLRLAEKLAEGTSFLRVDCFCIGDRLCIGEITFSPTGGFMAFNDGWDERLGALETLPERT